MQRRPSLGRRARVGIAASALVLGGGAAAVVIASHGSTPSAAQSASYSTRYGGNHSSGMSEWGLLNSAVSGWGSSTQSSETQLASVNQQLLSQTTQHGKTLDLQRGIVVFASQQFLILESKDGSLHLWALSGKTQFANVAASTTGSTAMTASMSDSQQAVWSGSMIPSVSTMAGDATTAQNLLTPNYRPQTVMVQVAGTDLTVTVTITGKNATVSQTATMPASGMPMSDPSTTTMSAWSTAGMTSTLARGDLALLVGSRTDGLLHASIVLYTPLSAGDVGGYLGGATAPHPAATPSPSSTVTGTHW
jgi:hypothetical protein